MAVEGIVRCVMELCRAIEDDNGWCVAWVPEGEFFCDKHLEQPISYPAKHVFKNLKGTAIFDREESWQIMKWFRRNHMINRKRFILCENEIGREIGKVSAHLSIPTYMKTFKERFQIENARKKARDGPNPRGDEMRRVFISEGTILQYELLLQVEFLECGDFTTYDDGAKFIS